MYDYEESGIVLRFPTEDFIPLDKTREFKAISTHHVKAVDIVYYQRESHTMVFIELKNFLSEKKSGDITSKDYTTELQKKSADSLLMMLSLFDGYDYMKNLHSTINPLQQGNPRFEFIHIMKVSNNQVPYVSAMSDNFRNKFAGIAKLFSIDHYMVITQREANTVLHRYGIEYRD
jgi:hypothetical protein